MINLTGRIIRLERRRSINRLWDAAWKEIARLERANKRRLAEWRLLQEETAENPEGSGISPVPETQSTGPA